MPVLSATFGGLFFGVLAAFVFALIGAPDWPGAAFFDRLVVPAFYVVAPISGIFIGLKTAGFGNWSN